MAFLMAFFTLAFACQMVPIASIKPSKNEVAVEVALTNSTESCNNYTLKFTNLMFKTVCQVKFQVKVPKKSTLENHWNIKPVNGTSDLFTFPDRAHISPGQSYTQAGITVNGAGKPKITVIEVKSVLSTKQCPAEAEQ